MTAERDPDPTIEDVPMDPGEPSDAPDDEGGPDVDSEEVPTDA